MSFAKVSSNMSDADERIFSLLQFSDSFSAEIYEPARPGLFDSFDDDEEDLSEVPREKPQWYRTQSGQCAKVLLEAEDDGEKLRLLQYLDGQSEFRRFSSSQACLFGPEHFENSGQFEDIADDGSFEELEESKVEEIIAGLEKNKRFLRGRGTSWAWEKSSSSVANSNTSRKRRAGHQSMTMDQFGNFISAFGTADQKRTAKTIVDKRDPGRNVAVPQEEVFE